MAMDDILNKASEYAPAAGAAVGSIFGPIGSLVGGGLGSIAGGLMSSRPKPTDMQNQQKELVDQLLASLKGDGPYSDLFNVNEESFNKGFRDPAMAQFKNQIAPQIQQQYIAAGQQRGTGMEDSLARAGVDMDQMLNQKYAQQQQQAQQNKFGAIQNIMSMGPGPQKQKSLWESGREGFAGYLTSPQFATATGNFARNYFDPKPKT